jgi:hypothetical protein
MTVARELARRIVASKFEQFTPGVMRYAKIGILDTLGVGVAGSCDERRDLYGALSRQHELRAAFMTVPKRDIGPSG